MAGLPTTEDPEQAMQLPFAARYLKCGEAAKGVCGQSKYNVTCWMPWPNSSFVPPTNQANSPGGQVGWHPGNR